MTYLTYNVTTNSGVVNVKTLEEAVSSGYPFVAVFTAVREPMASFGKGRQAVSRSEYMTGNVGRVMESVRTRFENQR